MTNINLSVELTEQEAWDYAQFLKRVGFSEFRTNAHLFNTHTKKVPIIRSLVFCQETFGIAFLLSDSTSFF
jgi:hypothetical protein